MVKIYLVKIYLVKFEVITMYKTTKMYKPKYKTYHDDTLDKKICYKEPLYLIDVKFKDIKGSSIVQNSTNYNEYYDILKNPNIRCIFITMLYEYYENASNILLDILTDKSIIIHNIKKKAIAIDKSSDRQSDKSSNRQSDKSSNRQSDKSSDRQSDKSSDRQSDKSSTHIPLIVQLTNINAILNNMNSKISIEDLSYVESTEDLNKSHESPYILVKIYDVEEMSNATDGIIQLFDLITNDKNSIQDKFKEYELTAEYTIVNNYTINYLLFKN